MAEHGIYKCKLEAEKKGINIENKYNKGLECCKKYVYGKDNLSEVIKVAIFFSKLEQVFRRRLLPTEVNLELLFEIEEEIVNDLFRLSSIFYVTMIQSGIITKESVVVYNPSFGGASFFCGGADADIFVDGTLYDFKCTKNRGYNWKDVAQIVGYFLLDGLAKKYNDQENDLNNYEINKLAFYRARYGEIEFFEAERVGGRELVECFEKSLLKGDYEEYIK